MDIYTTAASILEKLDQKKGTIKSLIYSSDSTNIKQLYALVCESLKFKEILEEISGRCGLYQKVPLLRNSRHLCLVLLYDHLIGKGLNQAGSYKKEILRFSKEIEDAQEKILEKFGIQQISDYKSDKMSQDCKIPRYVRVNLSKISVQEVVEQLVTEEWEYVESTGMTSDEFVEVIRNLGTYQFIQDFHINDVLAFAPGTDLHDHGLCTSGKIILQDKASCIPAHVVNPRENSIILDCCAAPGNKTSHLASFINCNGKIHAFDRDKKRVALMEKMIKKAGVGRCVQRICQDFLTVKPSDYPDAEYALVDPSCSGSGIIGRMNHMTNDDSSDSKSRLNSLSNFQVLLLKHALKFPKMKKVVYSTCSIHAEENEKVVDEAYQHVKDRFKLKKVMKTWKSRGLPEYHCGKYCLRLSPENDLCNGFFVACFKRRHDAEDLPVGESEINQVQCFKKDSGSLTDGKNVSALCSSTPDRNEENETSQPKIKSCDGQSQNNANLTDNGKKRKRVNDGGTSAHKSKKKFRKDTVKLPKKKSNRNRRKRNKKKPIIT